MTIDRAEIQQQSLYGHAKSKFVYQTVSLQTVWSAESRWRFKVKLNVQGYRLHSAVCTPGHQQKRSGPQGEAGAARFRAYSTRLGIGKAINPEY